MAENSSYIPRLSADEDVFRTKAVRIGVLLWIQMYDVAEAPIAYGCELTCYLKPVERWLQVCAAEGFEAAMMHPSGASWHVDSLLFNLIDENFRNQRIKDTPSRYSFLSGLSRVVRDLSK